MASPERRVHELNNVVIACASNDTPPLMHISSTKIALGFAASLALTACGSSDDAPVDAGTAHDSSTPVDTGVVGDAGSRNTVRALGMVGEWVGRNEGCDTHWSVDLSDGNHYEGGRAGMTVTDDHVYRGDWLFRSYFCDDNSEVKAVGSQIVEQWDEDAMFLVPSNIDGVPAGFYASHINNNLRVAYVHEDRMAIFAGQYLPADLEGHGSLDSFATWIAIADAHGDNLTGWLADPPYLLQWERRVVAP